MNKDINKELSTEVKTTLNGEYLPAKKLTKKQLRMIELARNYYFKCRDIINNQTHQP